MDRNACSKLLAMLLPVVALRKESVDRNCGPQGSGKTLSVALRKESVDRNDAANAVDQILPGVALRKESVDRNSITGMT